MSEKKNDTHEVETTGHSWDGIEEYNNPLPRWWLWTFYATTLWGIIYTIAFPAWPLISQATPGLIGFSTRTDVAAEIARFEEANAALEADLASVDLATISDEPGLYHYAVQGGSAIFRTWCAQCHGAGAAGAPGYPNLLDDDWLWGGDVQSIHDTIAHGVRAETDPDTRWSQMPAFGDILEEDQIREVVNYVLAISGQEHDGDLAGAGQQVFMDNCSSCHGEQGTGVREMGAPNLTDAIWLWGGDEETLFETVAYSRFGMMPAWAERLSEAELRAVAAYVHQLGGGE